VMVHASKISSTQTIRPLFLGPLAGSMETANVGALTDRCWH
jgi:hypothetical protein